MKIRVTIEYDPFWSEANIEKLGKDLLFRREKNNWEVGYITLSDLQTTGRTVKFELIE